MKERKTRQKELILDILKRAKTHPTIYELYALVSKEDPTIGKATIYRNIKKFINDGTIFVIKSKNGLDRYDYYNRHAHFECLNCGKIYDIYDDDLFKMLEERFDTSNVKVENYNLTIDGYCKECQASLETTNN